ncbi:MAG: AAA family ATPase [Anaerolineae bacterium]|nr:AAA family ATPase [Anaerolineae bacterium]
MTIPRVATGIPGLDKMLRGGMPQGAVVLVRGAPGTGKTSLAFQFLVHGAKQGEPGLFITFEEFPDSLYRDAASLGFDLQVLEREGKLHIIFTSPAVFLESLKEPDSLIYRRLMSMDIRRAVLDSATHFTRLTDDRLELRSIYTTLANSLRREQITTLLLSEEKRTDYQRADRGALSFLADGIILLRYVEVESEIQRAIVVLKMRGTDHAHEICHYRVGAGGLIVEDAFRGRRAILSGISRRI